MIRRPPRSTLFPTRRSSDLACGDVCGGGGGLDGGGERRPHRPRLRSIAAQEDVPHVVRSEEHTSELQSQSNLVCRLLLEKKKQTEPTRCTLSIATAT